MTSVRFRQVAKDGHGRFMWRYDMPGHGEVIIHQSGEPDELFWRFYDPQTQTLAVFDDFDALRQFAQDYIETLAAQQIQTPMPEGADAVRRFVVKTLQGADNNGEGRR